jgi:hypothetical protein
MKVCGTSGLFKPIWVVPQELTLLSLFFRGKGFFVVKGVVLMIDEWWRSGL